MPFLSNATFIFTPFVGLFIDARGFAPAAQGLGISLVAALLALWLLPLRYQWLSLLLLNLLQAVTYSLQRLEAS